ncbi:MAG: lipase family protein [Agarilytica sp.]
MTTLSPRDAAAAASVAYETRTDGQNVYRAAANHKSLTDKFDFENLAKFKSKSGAFFKVTSGFGYVVNGKGNNKDDVLIAIRGTVTKADWLTDGNIGLQVSSTGKMVHAGFNRAFREIEQQIAPIVPSGKNIHFCGHSLGGALATLGSDWASQKNGGSVNLYTFGSPRVGFKSFADSVTTKLGSGDIYRVHRSTDAVPMIPIWPFVHVPQPGKTCKLASEGFYSPLAAHSMDNYLNSVRKYEWSSLVTPEEIQSSPGKFDITSLQGIKSIGTYALGLLGKAIGYILKAAGVGVQGGLIVGISVLDMLSMALEKAAKVSAEIAGWVKLLIEKIISITGAGIAKIGDLTANFIRWVFQLLMSSIRRTVSLALVE